MSLRTLLAVIGAAVTVLTFAGAPPEAAGLDALAWLKTQGLYDEVNTLRAEGRYSVRSTAGAASQGDYEAANPQQGLLAQFGGGGVQVSPAAGLAASWRWGMRLVAYGYGDRLESVGAPLIAASGNRVEYRHGAAVTEWYVNSARGIEQGFTLSEPPAPAQGRRGALELVLAVSGDLAPRLAAGGNALEFVSDAGTPTLGYRDLHAWDATGRVVPARLSLRDGHVVLLLEDAAATYPLTVDPLVYSISKLAPDDGKADDAFGWWVALSGNTAVVGAPFNETWPGMFAGAAYVFVRSGGVWSQRAKLTPSQPAASLLDAFGAAVAISGDAIVVGAPGHDPGSKPGAGAAYVFVRSGETWSQQAILSAADGRAGDSFGFAVSINGNTVAVGAPNHDPDSKPLAGAAYVFSRGGECGGARTWCQRAKLTAGTGAAAGDALGYSLALGSDDEDGGRLVVGAPFVHEWTAGPPSGRVLVFSGRGASWTRDVTLVPADGGIGDAFGFSVGIRGNTVVVGAPAHNPGGKPLGGQAYVYVRKSGWSLQARLTASDGASGDQFGLAVDIDGNTIVVGAPLRETTAGPNAGQAYVFTRTASTWGEQRILTATQAAPQQGFGFAAAVDGSSILVGSPFHDSAAGPAAAPAYAFDPTPVFAAVWIGLANSDDVGLRLDLKAQVLFGGVQVLAGEADNVGTGSSGFSNAVLQGIPLAATGWGGGPELRALTATSGGGEYPWAIRVTISARVSCAGGGHSSGTPRLWYNGRAIDSGSSRDAGSRLEAPLLGRASIQIFLRQAFALDLDDGHSRLFVDQPLGSSSACPDRPFVPLGTWTAP